MTSERNIHPFWLRVAHWINALAVLVLVASGWQIYDASPIFPFRFPPSITLGGWLAGGLLWHFAAMWLLVANGLVYLALNVVTGRLARRLLPPHWLDFPREIFRDLGAALRGKLSHDDPSRYNAVQKAAYLFVVVDTVVLVLSGLVVWKSVQFPLLREVMGGYDNARIVHFFAMAAMVGFFVVHVAMAFIVPKSLLFITRGR